MTNLNGKVALVTGASRGLGNAIAERFALLGADVIVNYASSYLAAQELVKTIEGLGRRAIALKADVSKVSEIDALFEESKRQFSHIDIVVATESVNIGVVVF